MEYITVVTVLALLAKVYGGNNVIKDNLIALSFQEKMIYYYNLGRFSFRKETLRQALWLSNIDWFSVCCI